MTGDSFSKKFRLRKRSEFLRLSRLGTRREDRHFIFVFYPGFGHSRLGITVTRKVGNAATRNRIKRQIREFFRRNHHQLKLALDINIIVKKGTAATASADMIDSLNQLFKQLCAINDKKDFFAHN